MNRPVELTTALYRLTELKPDGREERCPSAFACDTYDGQTLYL